MIKKIFLLSLIGVFFVSGVRATTNVTTGYQKYNFQYLTSVMTRAQPTSTTVASAWNALGLPKYFSMGVTTTDTGWVVALQGSLDNINWSTLAVTNSAVGVVSSVLPKPMLYFRMLSTIVTGTVSVTGTAVGTP